MEFEEDPDYDYIEGLFEAIKDKHHLGDTFQWQTAEINLHQQS